MVHPSSDHPKVIISPKSFFDDVSNDVSHALAQQLYRAENQEETQTNRSSYRNQKSEMVGDKIDFFGRNKIAIAVKC